jgi:RNA polymerase sigma-70 factor (ECF subfamily)
VAADSAIRRERLEGLFDAHAASIHRYLRRRGAGQDADDLTAEVYAIAWRRIDDVPFGAERPWLYRTAAFVLANHRRRVRPSADADAEGLEPDVADGVAERDILLRAWRTLSERDREILRLVAWEGLDGRGLAEALGISVGGAAAALSRARTALAAAWSDAEAPRKDRSDSDI